MGNVCPNLEKKKFSWKRARSAFKYSNYLPWSKNSEKSNHPLLIKIPNWLGKTDKEQWFYGNLRRTGVQKHIWNRRVWLSLRGKNYHELNPFMKIMVHRSNIHYSKINRKWKLKKAYKISSRTTKNGTSRHPAQLSTWMGGLGILGMHTQLSSLKTKWIQMLLNPTKAFWKDLMLYWLNLILNSNRGLFLFKQTQILRVY